MDLERILLSTGQTLLNLTEIKTNYRAPLLAFFDCNSTNLRLSIVDSRLWNQFLAYAVPFSKGAPEDIEELKSRFGTPRDNMGGRKVGLSAQRIARDALAKFFEYLVTADSYCSSSMVTIVTRHPLDIVADCLNFITVRFLYLPTSSPTKMANLQLNIQSGGFSSMITHPAATRRMMKGRT